MTDEEFVDETIERARTALETLRAQCSGDFGQLMITLESMVALTLVERYGFAGVDYCRKFGDMCAELAPKFFLLKMAEEINGRRARKE